MKFAQNFPSFTKYSHMIGRHIFISHEPHRCVAVRKAEAARRRKEDRN